MIDGYAFSDCTSLTEIVVPNNVESIASYSFYRCTALKNVTIGKSISEINLNAFSNCNALENVYVLDVEPTSINQGAFTNNAYDNAILYVPVGCREAYMATDGWKKFKNIIEMDMTSVENVESEESGFNGLPDVYYDLNGRIVEQPVDGIYIINGKKVLVK